MERENRPLMLFLAEYRRKDQTQLRKSIAENCGVSIWIVKNWAYGITPVPTTAKKIINEMFNRKIFNDDQIYVSKRQRQIADKS